MPKCTNCQWSSRVGDIYYICRRFPPTIMRAGRWDYPEVDDRTPTCAEWDDGRHEQQIRRMRKEQSK